MTGLGSRESSAPDAAAAALASMMGIAAATASFAWARRSNWSIQRTDVEVASPRLPQAFDRMHIIHVSDLHNAEFGPGNARLLNAIRRAAPDVIFITGDLVDSRQTRAEVAVRFVAAAARIASVYYVPGNHESRLDEYPQIGASLKRVGATVLANRSVCLARDGECVHVAAHASSRVVARICRLPYRRRVRGACPWRPGSRAGRGRPFRPWPGRVAKGHRGRPRFGSDAVGGKSRSRSQSGAHAGKQPSRVGRGRFAQRLGGFSSIERGEWGLWAKRFAK